MMKPRPAAALIVAEPDLLLEFLNSAFDASAQFGEIDQAGKADFSWAKSTANTLSAASRLWPFDQQPFLRPGLAALEVALDDTNPQARKARSERSLRSLSPGDRSPCSEG